MKSYDEIDQENQPVKWWEFLSDITVMIIFSIAFAWVFVYGLPALLYRFL